MQFIINELVNNQVLFDVVSMGSVFGVGSCIDLVVLVMFQVLVGKLLMLVCKF